MWLEVTKPDFKDAPFKIFFFARWNRTPPPPAGTIASSNDLKYYLRIMRGPDWRMTVPLCVNGATTDDVEKLEAALAYMETRYCDTWFSEMAAWTPTRVFLIAVHAWATRDPRLQNSKWEEVRNLIPHVTPYVRFIETFDMLHTLAFLARFAKENLPLEIFHYREIYYREHWMAVGKISNVPTWIDRGTQYDDADIEPTMDTGAGKGKGKAMDTEAAAGDEAGKGKGKEREWGQVSELADGYDSDIHLAEDPRESATIEVDPMGLPLVSCDIMLF